MGVHGPLSYNTRISLGIVSVANFGSLQDCPVPIVTGGNITDLISNIRRSLGIGTLTIHTVITQYTMIPVRKPVVSFYSVLFKDSNQVHTYQSLNRDVRAFGYVIW